MSDIKEIIAELKSKMDIVETVSSFIELKKNKACCPFHEEKSPSFSVSPQKQIAHCFGCGYTADSIKFYADMKKITNAQAIVELKESHGVIDNGGYVEPKKLAPIPQQDYMSSTVIRKIFDGQIDLNFKDKAHKKLLDEFAPKRVFQSGSDEDIAFFVSSVKKSKHEDTTMILLRDEHGVETCLKYRWKMVGDNRVKWCGLDGVKSNFLYTRLTENPLTIVTEGTSDYLVAVLMGYSVISLPSASYKGTIPFELTKDRELIFMGDDGEAGQNAINRIMQETVCNKKKFNYADFREKYNLKGEDFKDLVIEYKSIEKFKTDLLEYVSSLDNQKDNDWLNVLRSKNNSVTRQIIKDTENMKMLIDGMLPHKQITTLVGQPNVGKSALTFAIINRLFEEKHIENVIYFDADNPLVYTKDRILKLMDMNGDDKIAYYTGSTASKEAMKEDLELLTNFRDSGEKTLIVIDSLKNFITGSINDDKSINPMFDLLQQVRDIFGATIITLHHTRKGKDEDGELNYVGSQVIEASSDNLTYISNVNGVLLLKNSKARALIDEKIAVDLDFDNMVFKATDIPEDEESDDVAMIVEILEAQGFIDKRELKNMLKGKVSAGDIEKLIKEHKNTMFKYKKDGDNWLVGLVAMEEPKYKAGVETVYVETAEDKMFNEADGLF